MVTSQQSITEEDEVDKQVTELSRYETTGDTSMQDNNEMDNLTESERKSLDAEKRAAWRKARLLSLESDEIQAQIILDKMSELSHSDGSKALSEDNASYLHPVDGQGNMVTDGEGLTPIKEGEKEPS